MFQKQIQIPWLVFTLVGALFITSMNYHFFGQIYQQLDADSRFTLKASFVIIYFGLLTSIFALLFVPYLTKFLMILLLWIVCLTTYFMSAYGVVIDKDMFVNVLRTDTTEAFSLLSPNLLLFIAFLGVLPTLLILKVRIVYFMGSWKKTLIVRIATFLLSLLMAGSLFYVYSQTIIPFFRNHRFLRAHETPVHQIYSVIKYIKQEVLPAREFELIAIDATLVPSAKKRLMIFVVGETARAANYSFQGYGVHDTNAYLKQDSIVYFSDFSSCGTSTAISVPCMFSDLKRHNFSYSTYYRENVLDILQKLGINVVWLDNNTSACQGVCKNLENVKLFKEPYDEVLLEAILEPLKELKEQNLIVLHLQGSHGPTYFQRYPDSFKKFTPTCDTNELQKCTEEELTNTYDNTLLYTDFLLHSLIEILKTFRDEYEVSLIYVSDHGESLGENGIYLHGMPYFMAPREQVHVPFIFFSENAELMEMAQKRKDLPFSHDSIFSTLLGYFGVQSGVYNVEDDLFGGEK